jgi:hypothetical protein
VGRDIFWPQMLAMAGLGTVLLATAMVAFAKALTRFHGGQQNDSSSGNLNFKSFV